MFWFGRDWSFVWRAKPSKAPPLAAGLCESECTACRQRHSFPCESSAIPQTTGTITRLCVLLNSVPNRSHPNEKGVFVIFVHMVLVHEPVCIAYMCDVIVQCTRDGRSLIFLLRVRSDSEKFCSASAPPPQTMEKFKSDSALTPQNCRYCSYI